MENKGDQYGINLNNLQIDWDALASNISEKIAVRKRPSHRRTAFRTAIIAAVLVMVAGFFVLKQNGTDANYDYAAYYVIPEMLGSYSVPASFMALSGYPDNYSVSAINEYILGNK